MVLIETGVKGRQSAFRSPTLFGSIQSSPPDDLFREEATKKTNRPQPP